MATMIQALDGGARPVSNDDLASFEEALHGIAVHPETAGYDEARSVWNGMIDRRPGLIVQCASADDVVSSVRFAVDQGLHITVRGGGHNVAGTAVADDALLVDLSEMRGVSVDPTQRLARAEAGARLGDLDGATQAHGLAVPVGVVSETGVAGLTLHGGLGWLTRRHGLSLDNLRSVDIVTADGRLRRASADHDADLFWAVRGAGPNFGIVTSFEFEAHPVGPDVWFAAVFYPGSAADEVLRFYAEHMPVAPPEIGTLLVYWTAPDEEFIPQKARGEAAIVMLACHSGSLEHGEEALRPFRNIVEPLADLTDVMPFTEVQRFLDADYPDGGHYYWKSLYLPALTHEVAAILREAQDARPSPESSIDVWALEGAATRIDPTSTAFSQRGTPYLIGIEANWHDTADDAANMSWARDLYAALEPLSHEGTYLNFPGFAEEGDEQLRSAYGANYERLARLKARYDPGNFFRGNLNVVPA